MVHSLAVARLLDPSATSAGDVKMRYDPADPEQLKAAEKMFKAAKKIGQVFYRELEGGELEVVHEWPEAAKSRKVRGAPPVSGG